MKKIFFILCILVSVIANATVKTSLKVEVLPADFCTKFYNHVIKVEQEFIFEKEDMQDTIIIENESASYLTMYLDCREEYKQNALDSILELAKTKEDTLALSRHLFFHVFVDGKRTEKYHSTEYGVCIPINKKKKCIIRLEYDYLSLHKIFGGPKNSTLCFDRYDDGGGSLKYICHFKTANMQWDKVYFFHNNDDELLWINKNNMRRNDTIFVNGHSSEREIEFYIINKRLQNYSTYTTAKSSLSIFAPKQFDIDYKTCSISNIQPNEKIDTYYEEITTMLNKLECFFGDTIQRNIVFLYSYFGEVISDDKYGAVFFNEPNDFIVLADTSLMRIMSHEMCHLFMPIKSSKMTKKEEWNPEWDILGEGLNEYISMLIFYDTQEQVDSATHAYINMLTENEQQIRVLAEGYDTLSTDYKYKARYERIPYVLNQFLHEIGRYKFIATFQELCKIARENDGVATLSDYEKILKSYGVTDEQWKNLRNNL